jgi:hypothetical protein
VIYSTRFVHNTNERAINFLIFHIVIYDKFFKCPIHVYLIKLGHPDGRQLLSIGYAL